MQLQYDFSFQNFKCQHNGTCFLAKTMTGKLQPECKCPDQNFEGRLCEFDKCESKYCKNGGKGFRQNGRSIGYSSYLFENTSDWSVATNFVHLCICLYRSLSSHVPGVNVYVLSHLLGQGVKTNLMISLIIPVEI